jgi:hypothetical protein
MKSLPTEMFKCSTMTGLMEQVVNIGVCTKCHSKSLRFVYACESFKSYQCAKCLRVFMTEPDEHHV